MNYHIGTGNKNRKLYFSVNYLFLHSKVTTPFSRFGEILLMLKLSTSQIKQRELLGCIHLPIWALFLKFGDNGKQNILSAIFEVRKTSPVLLQVISMPLPQEKKQGQKI